MRLEIKDVNFSYGSRAALEDVTMSIGEGEIVSLVGPNGSGKTTLLKCINRILKLQKGTVLVEEKDINKIKLKELAKLLSYVPQSVSHSFPSTVFEIVLIGRKPHLDWSVSSRDKEIVSNILSLMGLKDKALRQSNELSGGEYQKVLIARALAQEPQVLLLDEPTSNLDLKHQLDVLNLITSIVKKKNIAAVMAMHDLNLASRFSNKMIFLNGGMIYDAGKPENVLTERNIRKVYGVEAIVNKNAGYFQVTPIASISEG
nr:probable ABC transporter, ATP-binding protein [uncultured archaeon]CBH39917.1 probable ABC transporter, ATP-binding protein [uncultured archaeon]